MFSLHKDILRHVHVCRHGLLLLPSLFLWLLPGSFVCAASTAVVPIDWSRFSHGKPTDVDSERMRTILLNANRYALTTWWKAQKYDEQSRTILSFHGAKEKRIRPVANESFALAVSLATQAYDPKRVGVSQEDAHKKVHQLLVSLAHQYRATTSGGWGNSWQSASWASNAGWAAWLLWDDFSLPEKAAIQRMVTYEANRFNALPVPYYRSANGRINYPGDTKAEENAWNSTILSLAITMMPNHPNRDIWRTKMLEYSIGAFSRPSDVTRSTELHGQPLSQWLAGSNIHMDGSLINQKRLHPDYMSTVTFTVQSALLHTLAGMQIPQATFFNADIVYAALVNNRYKGKTIYTPGSQAIFYPEGSQWGTERRMQFALLDAEARAFGFDRRARIPAQVWETLHASRVLAMQGRFRDGRTYGAAGEDVYERREEWVADLAAQAYLVKWLQKQDVFSITNQAFPIVHIP